METGSRSRKQMTAGVGRRRMRAFLSSGGSRGRWIVGSAPLDEPLGKRRADAIRGARQSQRRTWRRGLAGLDGRVAYVALGPGRLVRVGGVRAQLELAVARGARERDALEAARGEDAEPDREQPRDEAEQDVQKRARHVAVFDEL